MKVGMLEGMSIQVSPQGLADALAAIMNAALTLGVHVVDAVAIMELQLEQAKSDARTHGDWDDHEFELSKAHFAAPARTDA